MPWSRLLNHRLVWGRKCRCRRLLEPPSALGTPTPLRGEGGGPGDPPFPNANAPREPVAIFPSSWSTQCLGPKSTVRSSAQQSWDQEPQHPARLCGAASSPGSHCRRLGPSGRATEASRRQAGAGLGTVAETVHSRGLGPRGSHPLGLGCGGLKPLGPEASPLGSPLSQHWPEATPTVAREVGAPGHTPDTQVFPQFNACRPASGLGSAEPTPCVCLRPCKLDTQLPHSPAVH